MDYKTATYSERQAFEKTLTTSQRAKMRRMEKEFTAQIQPIGWASNARQEEIRQEAWASLKVAERIKKLEEDAAPQINEILEQIQALQNELSEKKEELAEARSKIQTEPYMLAGEDAEVKAMNAIWRKTKEVQEVKFQKLVDSFTEEVRN